MWQAIFLYSDKNRGWSDGYIRLSESGLKRSEAACRGGEMSAMSSKPGFPVVWLMEKMSNYSFDGFIFDKSKVVMRYIVVVCIRLGREGDSVE